MRGQVPPLGDLVDPTGRVPDGGLVFRPSLRAAVGAILRFSMYTALVLLPPILITAWLGAELDPGPEPSFPLWPVFAFFLNGAFPIALSGIAAVLKVVFTSYVVDEDGIHVRARFLSSEEKRIPWEKVTSVVHRRTLFDTLLGVERLELASFGRQSKVHLVGLRGAAHLRDLVAQRMRASATAQAMRRLD